MLTVSDEQRQLLQDDGVPIPLIDAEAGKCYMVMPVDFSHDRTRFFRAQMRGIGAVAQAEVPSDAAMTLAMLLRKMLEQDEPLHRPL